MKHTNSVSLFSVRDIYQVCLRIMLEVLKKKLLTYDAQRKTTDIELQKVTQVTFSDQTLQKQGNITIDAIKQSVTILLYLLNPQPSLSPRFRIYHNTLFAIKYL